MTGSRQKPVAIAVGSERPTLSAEQRRFNELIAKIGKQRERMVAWEKASEQYHQKYTREWLPAMRSLGDLRVDLVRRLDEAAFDKSLNKREADLLAEIIVEMAKELLWDRDDAELKSIYGRHAGSDYDADKAAAAERRNAVLEETFGIDPGSLDEVLEEAEEAFRQAREASDDESDRSANGDDEGDGGDDGRSRRGSERKASRKQRALEEQQASEALHASQSIREVYRKLASALHPDREPDPAERARKTALMQRVNQAYANDDLLRLFELQLELEHIDESGIANVGDERLRYYNRVLAEQLRDLTRELKRVEADFRDRFGLPPSRSHSPKTMLRQLRDEIADIGHEIADFKRELQSLRDIGGVRRWLAYARRERSAPRYDD